jgi:hypothetical protein
MAETITMIMIATMSKIPKIGEIIIDKEMKEMEKTMQIGNHMKEKMNTTMINIPKIEETEVDITIDKEMTEIEEIGEIGKRDKEIMDRVTNITNKSNRIIIDNINKMIIEERKMIIIDIIIIKKIIKIKIINFNLMV